MNGKVGLHLGLALALMLLAGRGVRADYYYDFSPISNPTIYSDHSGMGIILANQPQIGPIASGANTNVVAATMTTFINSGVTGTDSFTDKTATLQLTIVQGSDKATGTWQLTFGGSLSAETSQITVAFVGGINTQILTVDGTQYKVTLNTIVPPGIPTAIPGSVGGSIVAGTISVQPGGGGGNTTTPEPSTMILSCLGLSLLGLARWRKRRSQ